jgi:hypothetical protein
MSHSHHRVMRIIHFACGVCCPTLRIRNRLDTAHRTPMSLLVPPVPAHPTPPARSAPGCTSANRGRRWPPASAQTAARRSSGTSRHALHDHVFELVAVGRGEHAVAHCVPQLSDSPAKPASTASADGSVRFGLQSRRVAAALITDALPFKSNGVRAASPLPPGTRGEKKLRNQALRDDAPQTT